MRLKDKVAIPVSAVEVGKLKITKPKLAKIINKIAVLLIYQ